MLLDSRSPERLWLKVNMLDDDSCWLWQGSVSKVKNSVCGKWSPPSGSKLSTQVHRAVWQITFGEVSASEKVLHTCKNSLCCNPKHLRLSDDPSLFWNLVDKKGDNDCWLYKGTLNNKGYGVYRGLSAHRYAYILHHKIDIPSNVFCCHKCDNPACTNWNHIFLGSQSDNLLDMSYKGRANLDAKNKPCKLTEDDVIQIKQMLATGLSQYKVAERFNITQAQVGRIHTGKAWKHLSDTEKTLSVFQVNLIKDLHHNQNVPISKLKLLFDVTAKVINSALNDEYETPKRKNIGKGRDSYLSEADKRRMSEMLKDGLSQSEIAKSFGLSEARVSYMKRKGQI